MKATDFDKKFDDNQEDIVAHLDIDTLTRPGLNQKQVKVDFPSWMVEKLDKEAMKLGVPRQSLIKVWIAERIKIESA